MLQDSKERFSDRVVNYIKYRPGYPAKIITYLQKEFNLQQNWQIADVGSGTGILTKLFLENGNTVYGIEPNEAMRNAAERLLKKCAHFISINGTAEQTGLEGGSIDMIIAGQAFHWFDPVKTKTEFQRIARKNTPVVLIWNERLIKSPFEKDYEKFILKYATDYSEINHKNISKEKIESFFSPNIVSMRTFYNEQNFDFNGLRGRLLSSSYIPNAKNAAYDKMQAELFQLFQRYETSGKIKIEYDTKVYAGKIK